MGKVDIEKVLHFIFGKMLVKSCVKCNLAPYDLSVVCLVEDAGDAMAFLVFNRISHGLAVCGLPVDSDPRRSYPPWRVE